MNDVITMGHDPAKNVFQVPGVDAAGEAFFTLSEARPDPGGLIRIDLKTAEGAVRLNQKFPWILGPRSLYCAVQHFLLAKPGVIIYISSNH